MHYALVSTPKYLLCVDLFAKHTAVIEETRAEYYGISWFPDSEQLILSHSALDNSTLLDIAAYAQSEVGYISSGSQVSRPFLSQPHQILCAPDHRIICTNTGRNVVSVIDLEKPGIYQEAGISSARWDRLSLELKIGDHINSVFLKDDQLFVICHRFDKGSVLATFAYPSLELTALKKLEGLTGLHNIWVTHEGQYISCNSEGGTLVDLATGDLLWSSGSSIFTRGLAASNEYVIVGESQKTGRDIRGNSLSGLWILEKDSWKVMDYICLGAFGCVHEVRLLDVPDEAHHGHPYQGLDSLLKRHMQQKTADPHYLAVASTVLKNYELWKDYQLIMGVSESLADGSKKAEADSLCLAVLNQKDEMPVSSFAFDYALNATAVAHVSAVIGYQGTFDDTHMNALLLQQVNGTASLSLWQHEGTEWRLAPEVGIHNLPTAGTMEVIILKNEISVLIQHKEVLRLNPADFGFKNYHTGFGIRWIGATVRPC